MQKYEKFARQTSPKWFTTKEMVQNHQIWCKGSAILRQKLSLQRFLKKKQNQIEQTENHPKVLEHQ